MPRKWLIFNELLTTLKVETEAHLEAEHQRLCRADALRLTAAEIVSQARVDVKSYMSSDKEFDSDTCIG